MQLKVNEIITPAPIKFNYEELKAELEKKVSTYETIVYTDDQIKEAKADKANLNKLKKALNDERIRMEKEYMKPFNEFKAQVNEIISIIDKPVAIIDKQLKEYEELRKQEKLEQISELITKSGLALLDIDEALIFNQKWLNASYTLKMIKTEIDKIAEKVNSDLAIIADLDEFSFEADLKYKQTLSLSAAVEEANRLKRVKALKEEAEKAAQETRTAAQPEVNIEIDKDIIYPSELPAEGLYGEDREIPGRWISFRAFLTVAQAKELKVFFKERGITFKALEG